MVVATLGALFYFSLAISGAIGVKFLSVGHPGFVHKKILLPFVSKNVSVVNMSVKMKRYPLAFHISHVFNILIGSQNNEGVLNNVRVNEIPGFAFVPQIAESEYCFT